MWILCKGEMSRKDARGGGRVRQKQSALRIPAFPGLSLTPLARGKVNPISTPAVQEMAPGSSVDKRAAKLLAALAPFRHRPGLAVHPRYVTAAHASAMQRSALPALSPTPCSVSAPSLGHQAHLGLPLPLPPLLPIPVFLWWQAQARAHGHLPKVSSPVSHLPSAICRWPSTIDAGPASLPLCCFFHCFIHFALLLAIDNSTTTSLTEYRPPPVVASSAISWRLTLSLIHI